MHGYFKMMRTIYVACIQIGTGFFLQLIFMQLMLFTLERKERQGADNKCPSFEITSTQNYDTYFGLEKLLLR